MTREESWDCEGTTRAILQVITGAGFLVSVHRLPSSLLGTRPATVEMHAVIPGSDPLQACIVTVEASDPDADYKAACELAKLAGVRLQG